jgi:hypothetical protein
MIAGISVPSSLGFSNMSEPYLDPRPHGAFVLMPVLLGSGLALIYHPGVDIGALSVGSCGQILTAKILVTFLSFGLAAVHGVVATRGSSRASRIVGIGGDLCP